MITRESQDKKAGAIFSDCERYRYVLWRDLRESELSEPFTVDCVWIGLNPSTADHLSLDNTCRRCLKWSQAWGCNRYVMLNAYAWRATKPRDMFAAEDPIGPDNDRYLLEYARNANIVIAAWGGNCDSLRQEAACKLLGRRLECLGLNGDGTPKHPLYVPGKTERVLFWEPGGT